MNTSSFAYPINVRFLGLRRDVDCLRSMTALSALQPFSSHHAGISAIFDLWSEYVDSLLPFLDWPGLTVIEPKPSFLVVPPCKGESMSDAVVPLIIRPVNVPSLTTQMVARVVKNSIQLSPPSGQHHAGLSRCFSDPCSSTVGAAVLSKPSIWRDPAVR